MSRLQVALETKGRMRAGRRLTDEIVWEKARDCSFSCSMSLLRTGGRSFRNAHCIAGPVHRGCWPRRWVQRSNWGYVPPSAFLFGNCPAGASSLPIQVLPLYSFLPFPSLRTFTNSSTFPSPTTQRTLPTSVPNNANDDSDTLLGQPTTRSAAELQKLPFDHNGQIETPSRRHSACNHNNG